VLVAETVIAVATMTAALAGRAMPAGTTGVAWAVAAAAGAVRESGAAAPVYAG
jgi:hypothetical protein